jgi:hypothetical protein
MLRFFALGQQVFEPVIRALKLFQASGRVDRPAAIDERQP